LIPRRVLSQEGLAVEDRHHQVDHDRVDRGGGQDREPLTTIGGRDDLELVAERAVQALEDVEVVIDDEDPCALHPLRAYLGLLGARGTPGRVIDEDLPVRACAVPGRVGGRPRTPHRRFSRRRRNAMHEASIPPDRSRRWRPR
jgi:hypothetical protein